MGKFLSNLKAIAKRFYRAQAGAAAVEFAFVVPLMLVLYVGTVEANRALSYDRRLETASAALGDLVAQSPTDITIAELNDLFTAAKTTIAPHSGVGVKQIVTGVSIDAAGVTNVEWSQGFNGGMGHAVDSSFEVPNEFKAIAGESFVIVSEAKMAYTPITGLIFPEGFNLSSEHFYLPRFGDPIDIL